MLAALGFVFVLAPAGASAHGLISTLNVKLGPSVSLTGSGGGTISDITLKQLAIAPDGTGGLVFQAQVGDVQHAFFVRIKRGVYGTPVELDSGLGGSATSPSVAVSGGGNVIVAFQETVGSTASVYTAHANSNSVALSQPVKLSATASAPALSMNVYGQGYLTLVKSVAVGGATSAEYVEAYFWDGTGWKGAGAQPSGLTKLSQCTASSPAALNKGIDAVSDTVDGAPAVFANHDGEAIVAWAENGKVYSTRLNQECVEGVVKEDDLASYRQAGTDTTWTDAGASSPQVSGDGNSTYESVTFDETFAAGNRTIHAVVDTRDISTHAPIPALEDGFGRARAPQASAPQIASNESGYGTIVDLSDSGSVDVSLLLVRGVQTATTVALGSVYDGAGEGAIAVAGEGNESSMVAWIGTDQNGSPEVLADYQPAQSTSSGRLGFRAPVAISDQSGKADPVDPGAGVLAGSDAQGDGVLAWVQGSKLYLGAETVAPYVPSLGTVGKLTTRSLPKLSWSASYEDFGSVIYTVKLDGKTVASTTKLSLQLAKPLAAGTHRWSVTATNVAGQSATTATRSFIVARYVAPKAAKVKRR